MNKCKRKP